MVSNIGNLAVLLVIVILGVLLGSLPNRWRPLRQAANSAERARLFAFMLADALLTSLFLLTPIVLISILKGRIGWVTVAVIIFPLALVKGLFLDAALERRRDRPGATVRGGGG